MILWVTINLVAKRSKSAVAVAVHFSLSQAVCAKPSSELFFGGRHFLTSVSKGLFRMTPGVGVCEGCVNEERMRSERKG